MRGAAAGGGRGTHSTASSWAGRRVHGKWRQLDQPASRRRAAQLQLVLRSCHPAARAASLPASVVVLPPRLVVRPGVGTVHTHALDGGKVLLQPG